MKIVSIDVGIKNLAYCILETDSQLLYKIHAWGIIDLVENEIIPCSQLNSKGLPCTVKASIYDITNGDKVYYCGRHKKRATNKLKNIKVNKASKMPLGILGCTMFRKFSELPQLLEADRVVIENQPVLKNPKMKSIQMMIYSYFLFNGKCSSASPIDNLILFSASKKLDVYKGDKIECSMKDKYAERKYLSIEYTQRMIHNQIEALQILNETPKKDDLADAYMQGCYYLMRNATV